MMRMKTLLLVHLGKVFLSFYVIVMCNESGGCGLSQFELVCVCMSPTFPTRERTLKLNAEGVTEVSSMPVYLFHFVG